MSRLPKRNLEDLSAEQKVVFDYIVANRAVKPTGGHIGGPFDPWLGNPDMCRRLVELAGMFRFNSMVDRRYIELTILTTGAHWKAQFEWFAHEPMARKAGVPDAVIEAIRSGETPDFVEDADRACWRMVSELHRTKELTQDSYDAAIAHFGAAGVAEIIALAGFYSMVSMTLNAFDVDLPAGATPPFDK
ncbi:MAG: hypothetical protein R3E86_14585 [Pseudomonadales bacterium]